MRTIRLMSSAALATLLPVLVWAQDAAAPVAAAAAAAPVPNKGDTAWMLTSTALVLLMSVPALALFYGGLVRTQEHAVGADAGVRRASR